MQAGPGYVYLVQIVSDGKLVLRPPVMQNRRLPPQKNQNRSSSAFAEPLR